MSLQKNIKIEGIDEFNEENNEESNEESNEDKNNFKQKYILMIEGYSKSSNIGFIKNEIIYGNNVDEAIFCAYDKIGTNLFVNYNINIDEMMTSYYRLLETDEVIQCSGFAFYNLSKHDIQEFREDEERYLMSCEDK